MRKSQESFSIKQLKLGDLKLGDPILDNVVRLLLEPNDGKINIRRVTFMDGISIKDFDLTEDVSRRITLKGQGRVRENSKGSNSDIMVETIDAGGNMIGIGSLIQLGKIGRLLIQKSGLVSHDGKEIVKADLKFGDKIIGQAIYTITKYSKMSDVPKALGPLEGRLSYGHLEALSKTSSIVSESAVDVDLSSIEPSKQGYIAVNLGENFKMNNFSPEHLGDVAITVDYLINVENTRKEAASTKSGSLRLSLGRFTFENTKNSYSSMTEF